MVRRLVGPSISDRLRSLEIDKRARADGPALQDGGDGLGGEDRRRVGGESGTGKGGQGADSGDGGGKAATSCEQGRTEGGHSDEDSMPSIREPPSVQSKTNSLVFYWTRGGRRPDKIK